MSTDMNLRVRQPLADFRDALTTSPPSSLVRCLVELNIVAPPDEFGKLAALLEHGLQFDHVAGASPSLVDMDQAHIDLYGLHGITPENNYHFHNWLWTNVGKKDRATIWPRLARCEASIRQSARAPYYILCLLNDLDEASAQAIVDARRQAFDEMCPDDMALLFWSPLMRSGTTPAALLFAARFLVKNRLMPYTAFGELEPTLNQELIVAFEAVMREQALREAQGDAPEAATNHVRRRL